MFGKPEQVPSIKGEVEKDELLAKLAELYQKYAFNLQSEKSETWDASRRAANDEADQTRKELVDRGYYHSEQEVMEAEGQWRIKHEPGEKKEAA
jgi:hypothetical protein